MRPATAEADVRIEIARDVEPERVGKDRLVTVGRRVVNDDLFALADQRAADLDVPRCRTPEIYDRGHPANDFVGRRTDQLRPALEQLPLIRIFDESLDATGDRVSGRLVAGDHEQHEEQVEFEFRQRMTMFVWADQVA